MCTLVWGCSKDSNPGTNPVTDDPNGGGDKLSYTVNEITDLSMRQIDTRTMSPFVKKLSGSGDVKLIVSGLPTGLTVDYSPAVAAAPYGSVLTFKALRVPEGIYPLQLLAYDKSADTQKYDFKVTIQPYINASDAFDAEFIESHDCSQSGQAQHTAYLRGVVGVKNQIVIKGFWSQSWSSEILANLNPANKTIDVPEQVVNDLTFKGNGTYDDNKLVISYTVNGAVVNETCTATFTRK